MEDLAIHAHNIRNNFFDTTKKLVEVIPNVLLKTEQNLNKEIEPRKLVPLAEGDKPSEAPSEEEAAEE